MKLDEHRSRGMIALAREDGGLVQRKPWRKPHFIGALVREWFKISS